DAKARERLHFTGELHPWQVGSAREMVPPRPGDRGPEQAQEHLRDALRRTVMQTRNPHGYHRSAQFCASSLLLHRENYLKEDREFRDRFRHLARSLPAVEVLSLLRAADWREAIVGPFNVLALRL